MSSIRLFYIIGLLASLSVTAYVEAAQTSQFEVTPLVGYRFGGDFDMTNGESVNSSIKLNEDVNYGVLFAWDYDRKRQGEFLISQYNSQFSDALDPTVTNNNITVTYAQLGGNVPISEDIVPVYLTGGFGLTHLAPEDKQLGDETRFSLNIGLATKISMTEHLSLRFGGRLYGTFFNSDSKIFCNEAVCSISISSNLWIQSEVNAGLTFTF